MYYLLYYFSLDTEKELKKIRDNHAECLANIPPGIGTQRNESFHKNLNMLFYNRTTVTLETALALLSTVFFAHNDREKAYTRFQEPHNLEGTSTNTHTSDNFKEREEMPVRYVQLLWQ